MRVLQVLAMGAQLAAAISFTNPAANETLTRGATFDLSWASVDTDPTSFSVYLVNFVNWPPFYTALDVVQTSAGEASVRVPCDVDTSYGYQFNAINGTNVYVIYAQTPKFSIAGASCSDPPSTSTACAAAPTVTVYTVRGNSTLTPPSSIPGSGASAAATTATPSLWPATIGWSGNYSNPVTLSENPQAGRGAVAPQTTTTAPTTLTIPTSVPIAATVTGAKATETGADKVKTKGCSSSKKRQARKRHSDGNGKQTKPMPMRR
ncbi:unnamed protein product [Discula destructiva]